MKLSYVIISYNRRDTLAKTLELLPDRTPLPADQWDIWVVDNASTDGTPEMLAEQFPHVHFIRLTKNIGMPGRNEAFAKAGGEYLICLDDDSYPTSGETVARMIQHMDVSRDVAAVVARVELPDGTPEAPAFPTVLLGGATCFRASAIKEVGGFAADFFRQAEEYELSFRIWSAGYRIERFEDIVFRHDKVPGPGRSSALVHRMDVRNNLIVTERFLPKQLRRAYRADWTLRYSAMAKFAGHVAAARSGWRSARIRGISERLRGRLTMSEAVLDRVFQFSRQTTAVQAWANQHGMRRVCIADFSKNLFATLNACAKAGLRVEAVLDDSPAFEGLYYRGVPIRRLADVAEMRVDGVVLSNTNPAQIDRRLRAIHAVFAGPVLRLWQPKYLGQSATMC